MDQGRSRYTFFIDAQLRAGLTAIKERDGISESEQIRRAVKRWLVERGELPAPSRKSKRSK